MDSVLSLPLFLAAVALVLTWRLLSWWHLNRKLPPGPWGPPLLGYYPFLSAPPSSDLTALAGRYGNVFSFRTLGGRLVIVLNGSRTIKEVLVNRGDEFVGRPSGNSLVAWVSDGIGITQEEGEEWSEQRRFFLQSAKNFGFGKLELEERIQDEIRDMLSDFRGLAGKGDVDVQFHVAYANNCIISHVLFDRKFSKEEFYRRLFVAMSSLVKLFVGKRHILVGYMLDLVLMFSPSMREAKRGREVLRKLTHEVVEDHVRTLDPNHSRDYVDAYLLAREQVIKATGKEGTFTMERLEANALNLFLEGTESVSFTTAHLLWELSRHVEAQRAAQRELDEVVGAERLPSWLDRQRLPLLEATILECQRIAAPFLLSTMYSNFKETTIEGYAIPKRSVIIFNLGTIHFDPELFPDPYKFDPTRFLDADGKRLKREGPYIFGLGKRSCLGESLAQMEVFLMIGSILQHYTLHPGEKEDFLRVEPRQR